MSSSAFAEVIESSLHGWLAQSWQWDQFPSFGSLVSITQKDRLHVGIVSQIQTGSMDPSRYPFPYKKTEEELIKEQPQIFEFLKTTFQCVALGYFQKGKLYYTVSPHPPKIHAFVAPLAPDLAQQFLSSEKYLHTLFSRAQKIENIDELLLALLSHQQEEARLSTEKITRFMQTYSLLTGNDYRRIKLFLQRVPVS